MARIFVILCLLLPGLAGAAVYDFQDPAQEARYRELTQQLRCLVCQGQSVADSNSELAEDLKREVHQQLQAGRSDEQIRQFMVDRYGEFVLYTPPVKRSTYLLWFGPFLLLLTGIGVVLALMRRRPAAAAMTEAERERARQLLAEAEREHTP